MWVYEFGHSFNQLATAIRNKNNFTDERRDSQTSLKMAVKAALVGSHSGMKKRDQTSLGGP